MGRNIIVVLVSMLLAGCHTRQESAQLVVNYEVVDTLLDIPATVMRQSALHYDNQISEWSYDGQPYSGYAETYYEDGSLKERIGILHGRKQNQAEQWCPDGRQRAVATYHKGRLHGEKRVWASDAGHALIAHLRYKDGKAHGAQTKWYPTGEVFKKLNLNMGKEEGLQQAFRKNGDLYANYEAKEGRVFGLKKAALCYGLEDERLKNEK